MSADDQSEVHSTTEAATETTQEPVATVAEETAPKVQELEEADLDQVAGGTKISSF